MNVDCSCCGWGWKDSHGFCPKIGYCRGISWVKFSYVMLYIQLHCTSVVHNNYVCRQCICIYIYMYNYTYIHVYIYIYIYLYIYRIYNQVQYIQYTYVYSMYKSDMWHMDMVYQWTFHIYLLRWNMYVWWLCRRKDMVNAIDRIQPGRRWDQMGHVCHQGWNRQGSKDPSASGQV